MSTFSDSPGRVEEGVPPWLSGIANGLSWINRMSLELSALSCELSAKGQGFVGVTAVAETTS
jgi:hypothetical protein